MIRFIASDIDGTLLHGSETSLHPALFDEIRRLRKKGILFAPCSGRQYYSLRDLFAPVADDIYYICENGSCIFSPGADGKLLFHKKMAYETVLDICNNVLSDARCQLMICSPQMGYLIAKDDYFEEYMQRTEKNLHISVDRPEQVPDSICKISVFCEKGLSDVYDIFHTLRAKWEKQVDVAISGRYWVDINLADKRTGIEKICEILGISPSEIMAFGDNYNDLPMLDFVGKPYLVDSAAPELLAKYPLHCSEVIDVLKTL